MSRPERVILTNMCMVSDGKGNVLMQNRLKKDWPGLIFPGGHVEPGESFTEAAIRETIEETGLTIEDPQLCGVKQFQTDSNARYVVFFYKATRYHGTLQASNEGEVFWIPRKELSKYRTVDDFSDMVKVFETPELSEFYYYKDNGKWGLKLL